jgi:hypothetical protein
VANGNCVGDQQNPNIKPQQIQPKLGELGRPNSAEEEELEEDPDLDFIDTMAM